MTSVLAQPLSSYREVKVRFEKTRGGLRHLVYRGGLRVSNTERASGFGFLVRDLGFR